MARRVNTKFLTILLLVIIAIAGGIFGALKLLIHEKPGRYIALGDDAMQTHKWSEAVDDYAKAAKLAPRDPAVQTKLGRALGKTVQNDPDAFQLETQAYSRALEIDPNYVPALKELSDVWRQAAEQRPDAMFYRNAIDYSKRARALDPSDKVFSAFPDRLVIQELAAGLPADPAEVDAALKRMSELWKENPGDGQLPFSIAEASIQRGIRAANQAASRVQPKEVTDDFARAVATFETVLTGPHGGSQGGNAQMHYYFSRILTQLAGVDQSSVDAFKNYMDRASAEVARAQALLKPDDPNFLDINEYAAEIALSRGDRAGAIAIYKKLPDSPTKNLALADVLGRLPETRAEGVRLLKSSLASLPDDASHVSMYTLRYALMREMANLQVMDYATTQPSPERSKMHDEIRASLDKLDQVAGIRTDLPLKQVEARFAISSGGSEEMNVIQSLSKLMVDNPAATKDNMLELLLAQGYLETHQPGSAIPILQKISRELPHEIQVRKQLIAAELTEQPDQATTNLDELEKQDPKDPTINLFRLQLLLSDPEKLADKANQDKIRRLYAGLHEDTPDQIKDKARIALQVKDYPEAVRLFTLCTVKDPHDVFSFFVTASILAQIGHKDDALAIANKGLVANPGDPQLRILIPRIQGEDPKKIQDIEVQLAKENPDKVQGEMILAAMAVHNGDDKGEEEHLKAADKLSPNSPRVQQLLFALYLRTGRYQEASDCIPVLAKADADHAGGEFFRLTIADARGDHAGAEAIARALTQNKPEFPKGWLALGDVLVQEGQYEQAIPQYFECLQKQPLVEAYTSLVQCYYAIQKPDFALHTIEDGLARVPASQAEPLRKMKLQYELNYGSPQEAVKEIGEELKARPDQPELYAARAGVLIQYAGIMVKNKQADDAIMEAKNAVATLEDPLVKWPDEPELYIAMSQSQIAAKEPEAALKTLQAWAAREQWKTQPEPYQNLADFYERAGNPDEAEKQLRTALGWSKYRASIQIEMATLLAMHKKFDDALSLLRTTNKDNPGVREKTVQILLVEGKFDDAQTELKADLATHPVNSERLLTMWALALFERGMYPDAVDRATQALAENPKDPTALFCRGRARLELKPPDAAGALQDLDLVRQSAPNDSEIRLYLSDAQLRLNHISDAISDLEAGLKGDPSNKRVRLRLVDLYVNNPHPRLNDAMKLLQEIQGTPPFDKDPDIFQAQAVILNKMGDDTDALAMSEIAIKLAPNDQNVARTNMQLLHDLQNFQGVADHYAAMSDKLKQTSWALWDLGLAEKQLGSPQALADMKRALAGAVQEDNPEEIDQISASIKQSFGYDEAVNALTPLAEQSVSCKLSLAHIYQGNGNDAAALGEVDQIMAADFDKIKHRDQVNVLASAAIMYQLAKPKPLVDKSYEAYEHWLKLEPNNLEALNNMACLLADNYSPPRAKEGLDYANRAVGYMTQIGRTEPRLLDTQAWLMILSGSAADGVHLLNTSMDQFAPFPEEYFHLGEGYLRLDTPDPVQAETQAKLGLHMIKAQKPEQQDAVLKAKLEDLVNRSEDVRHGKQQVRVP